MKRGLFCPRLGIFNLHSGLLPEYRGVMPTFWAMYNGSVTIGATLHRVTYNGIDVGDIVSRREIRVQYEKSVFSNIVMVYESGIDLVADAVKQLAASGKVAEKGQTGGKYYGFPSERELEAFRRQGNTLIGQMSISRLCGNISSARKMGSKWMQEGAASFALIGIGRR